MKIRWASEYYVRKEARSIWPAPFQSGEEQEIIGSYERLQYFDTLMQQWIDVPREEIVSLEEIKKLHPNAKLFSETYQTLTNNKK